MQMPVRTRRTTIIANVRLDREARAGLRLHGLDGRVAWRSRVASVGLVLVLLAVSLFAVWSSVATSDAASRAVAASGLSDDYARAASALNAEESLEYQYFLDPAARVRASHAAVAAVLVAALGEVRRVGDAKDRALVDRVLVEHRAYFAGIDRLFAAVDRGDKATVLRVDRYQTEPAIAAIDKAVGEAAAHKRQFALAEIANLQRLEASTRRLTPLVFLAGLVLAAMLTSITRGHRRLLDIARARAVHDSLHDPLTGLPNRALLADRCGQVLRADARAGTSAGLLLLGLDRFKEINGTLGHHYGDELLTQVGARLAGVVRGVDTVARAGGDEFAVLLPDVGTLANARTVAAKLRAALETPFNVEGVDLDVEASVGVVLAGRHGRDAATLLQRADVAMHVAKTQNLGVSTYDPAIDGYSPAKLALLGELRRALDRGELALYYQPQVNINTGDVVGVEALVRWQHPDRGLVFPDEFIPLAEHTGLIGPLTRHVLDIALAQARTWSDAGRALTVSVNLAARNLLDEGLPDQVAELLVAHGVAPELLELEVTETAIMTDPVQAQQVLEQLATMGTRISIDDFGVGYTSLGQLKNLPVSEIKIDQSFVMTMIEDPSNALIVRSVVDLGHNLGFKLVAEGVETAQILTALAGLRCDVAQGYHFSRPITAAAFDTWCVGRNRSAQSPAGFDTLTLTAT
jgi:diguanylate cyclase (GGDEF)-like protein